MALAGVWKVILQMVVLSEGSMGLCNCRSKILFLLTAMPTPTTDLQASLERHNATFELLLKHIPAKHYLVQDNDEQVGFLTNYRRLGT